MNKNSSTKELDLSNNERLFLEDNSLDYNIYKNFKPKGINYPEFSPLPKPIETHHAVPKTRTTSTLHLQSLCRVQT